MPRLHNATVSDPGPTYADLVPPYPFDFDFEPDASLPPSYASLDFSEPEAGAAWQIHGEGLEPARNSDEHPMERDSGRWCPSDIVGALAVGIQLVGVLAFLYSDLGSYNPFGLK